METSVDKGADFGAVETLQKDVHGDRRDGNLALEALSKPRDEADETFGRVAKRLNYLETSMALTAVIEEEDDSDYTYVTLSTKKEKTHWSKTPKTFQIFGRREDPGDGSSSSRSHSDD